jgi:hypothetical protein
MPDQVRHDGNTSDDAGHKRVSGLLQRQDRGQNDFDKEICRHPDKNHQKQGYIKPGEPVFAGIFGIVKNLFATGSAPVGTLLTDKPIAAFTGDFFRR